MSYDHGKGIPARRKNGLADTPPPGSKLGFAEECVRQARLTQDADRKDIGLDALLEEALADLGEQQGMNNEPKTFISV